MKKLFAHIIFLPLLSFIITLPVLAYDPGLYKVKKDTQVFHRLGTEIDRNDLDSTKLAVIIIHGLNNNIDSDSILSLTNRLENDLSDKCELFSFQYSTHGSIESNGMYLAVNIANFIGNRPFVLIGHSMGGLVARSALESPANRYVQGNDLLKQCIRLITLGTPHHGSPMANIWWLNYKYPLAAGIVKEFLDYIGINIDNYDLSWDNFDNRTPFLAEHAKSEFLTSLNINFWNLTEPAKKYVFFGGYRPYWVKCGVECLLQSSTSYVTLGYDVATFTDDNAYTANDGIVPLTSSLFLRAGDDPLSQLSPSNIPDSYNVTSPNLNIINLRKPPILRLKIFNELHDEYPKDPNVQREVVSELLTLTSNAPPNNEICIDNASFVQDLSVFDGQVFDPNQTFTKTWRIMNSGTCAWGPGYRWVFDGGNKMDGPDFIDVPATSAGRTWDPSIRLTSPANAGTYTGYWRLQDSQGNRFGTRMYVTIKVAGGGTPPPSQPPLGPNECAKTQNTANVLKVRDAPNGNIIGNPLGDNIVLQILNGPILAGGIWWYKHDRGGWSAYASAGYTYLVPSGCPDYGDMADGTLLREASKPEVYVIEGGAKLHIFGFSAPGFTPDNVRVVPDGALDGVSTFPRDGTLLQEYNHPEVYVVFGAAKLHIFGLNAPGYEWSNVRVVPEGTLNDIPTIPRDGTLLRDVTRDEVYVVIGGAKLHIFGLDAPGYFWDNVRVVPEATLEFLPLVPRDGTLLRETSSAPVYVIRDGKKFHVLSLEEAGYSWNDVRVVPDHTLDFIPDWLPPNNPPSMPDGSQVTSNGLKIHFEWNRNGDPDSGDLVDYRLLIMDEGNVLYDTGWGENLGSFDWVAPSVKEYSFKIGASDRKSETWTNPVSFVPSISRGDINIDSSVDVQDASLCLQFIVGITTLSDAQKAVADMNNDSSIDVLDVILILRQIVGLP